MFELFELTDSYIVLKISVDFCELFVSVSKTNLSVHEDKNRVPYVKVQTLKLFLKLKLILLTLSTTALFD